MVIFCKNETNGKEIATKRNLKYHFLTLPAGQCQEVKDFILEC